LSREQREGLKRADLVVWGGGALLADNACRTLVPFWFLVITYVKLVLRKPVVTWAHGLVLNTRLGRLLARRTLEMTDSITVRDANSLEAAVNCGVPRERVRKTADPAITLAPGPTSAGRKILADLGISLTRPVFVISPTFWHLYHKSNDIIPYIFAQRLRGRARRNQDEFTRYCAGLSGIVDRCVARGADVLFLPRYPCPPWKDVELLQEIAAGRPDRVFVLTRDDYPPADYFAIFRVASLVISVALHDAMFAISQLTPCLNLYYEPKGSDFYREIGLDEFAPPWTEMLSEEGLARIDLLITRLLEEWPQRRTTVAAARQRLVTAASANLEPCQAIIGETPPLRRAG
jgi:polysaccharide pyruvyl transferase WcaK-like protein